VTVTCTAALGAGGLGRHLEEIVGALERTHADVTCICDLIGGPRAGGAGARRPHPARLLKPLGRVFADWRLWRLSVEFDAAATALLPRGQHLIGFNGTSLAQLRAARSAGAGSTGLVAANPHADELVEAQRRAHADYPLERPWAGRVRGRNMREYELADRIYCSSRYIRDSFLERGFSEDRLAYFPLTPHPRFSPASVQAVETEFFEVAFVGTLLADKGVPLLIDAVRRLPYDDLRLRLVGGWKTRPMRQFVQRACAADPRISAGHGDPLVALGSASVCVHDAYQDGFAYAPAEAMACGVPVIVSEHTGMKDLIAAPRDGCVLPTGDLDALCGALEAAYRGELF
jgi:glycosyltransferase involved in cell wall biosynthesis